MLPAPSLPPATRSCSAVRFKTHARARGRNGNVARGGRVNSNAELSAEEVFFPSLKLYPKKKKKKNH